MDAFAAISKFCSYQERCHKEVRNKLYELGCNTCEVEQHIVLLIENGALNEQRYANAIVRGKFKLKKWGRHKIVHQLKGNQISPFCIKEALKEIDSDDYLRTLTQLAERKLVELRTEKSLLLKRQKVYRYLLQKGYESALINDVLEEILAPSS